MRMWEWLRLVGTVVGCHRFHHPYGCGLDGDDDRSGLTDCDSQPLAGHDLHSPDDHDRTLPSGHVHHSPWNLYASSPGDCQHAAVGRRAAPRGRAAMRNPGCACRLQGGLLCVQRL